MGVTPHEAYADDELAALYDLVYADYDDDLLMYEQFAARGELPTLELGVGSGRVALHLARQGFAVTGIDSSPLMLSRLRAALDAETEARLRLVEADMRDFDLGAERFDLAYCAFETFEHLLTTTDQVAALRCVARHLAPSGVFVAQLRSLMGVDWSAGPSPLVMDWTRADPATGETVTKLRSASVSRAEQTTTDTLLFDRIAADGTVRRRTFDVTLRVSGRYEIEMALELAGLQLSALYGDTDLSPFMDASDTMVVVAELERD